MITPVTNRLVVNAPLPPLAVGDVVSLKVTGVQPGKVTITLNGSTLEADTAIPLQIGERLTVRIASLEPRVVLVPLTAKKETTSVTLERYLKLLHQEPKVMEEMLRTGLKLLTGRSSDAHRELLPENLLAAVTEKFTALFDAGRDVKNCATTMGLFHERNVAQGAANADNLKALLLKLDGALERLSTTKPTEVRELAQWVKMAVERIDVCQLMNVVSRQRDGLLYLPIPFLFQNEVRVGGFFFAPQEDHAGEGVHRLGICRFSRAWSRHGGITVGREEVIFPGSLWERNNARLLGGKNDVLEGAAV